MRCLPEGPIRKVLICQQRQIGDVLLATPAISLLRRRFPGAEIHFFTEKKCAPLLEHHPDLSRIWLLEKGFLSELSLYRRAAREGFDLVVDFQQLPRCRWMTLLSRAGVRLSYPPRWYKKVIYNCWSSPEPGYAVQSKISLLRPLGIEWKGEKPRMYLSTKERKQANQLLVQTGIPSGAPFITIDPTHRRETRLWPAEHFSRLIALAASRWKDLFFLVLYGPGEQDTADQIVRSAGTGRCITPRSLLSLREMAAVIARAGLHLGTCSAPRHMAVALDTPSLAIMGSTSPGSWTYPSPEHRAVGLDIPCRPCNRDACEHIRCMRELLPEQVATELDRMIEESVHKRIQPL
ncbi:MAG: glycosyltransferase family 9 protein [Desulfovibrionales bacterium]